MLQACADKLKREMQDFGFPPVFPVEQEEKEEEKSDTPVIQDKAKGKKVWIGLTEHCVQTVSKNIVVVFFLLQSKLKAKSAGFKYQWQIMQSLGMEDDEIKLFADPAYWLSYFPPHCKADLQKMGLKVHKRARWFDLDQMWLRCTCIALQGWLATNVHHDWRKPVLRFLRPMAVQTFEASQQSAIRQTVN